MSLLTPNFSLTDRNTDIPMGSVGVNSVGQLYCSAHSTQIQEQEDPNELFHNAFGHCR